MMKCKNCGSVWKITTAIAENMDACPFCKSILNQVNNTINKDMTSYMPIEEVFPITGRDPVAVGKVAAGAFRVGDQVDIILKNGGRISTTVSMVEVYKKIPEVVKAGDNAAISLKGVKHDDLKNAIAIVNANADIWHRFFYAEIQFFGAGEGNKKPMFNYYYPAYSFPNAEIRGITKIYAENNQIELILPGTEAEISVELDEPAILVPGMPFIMHEGGDEDVARGKILEITD